MLDGKGEKFAELFESDHRRVWVPLKQIPEYVQLAFVAAEDKRFYQHKGIDERGLIRAFITNIAEPGRPQGGSTITQQVAKNLLVGDDVSYERKIREMIVASRIDQSLSKDEILEIYLNSIYLGRGAWGIDMAARSYFKKPASALTVTEGAMLAAMAKGPSYFSPDRYPERARERYAYVLKRMQEDKVAGAESVNPGVTGGPRIVPYERPRREGGLPLRRSSDARSEDAGRHAVADRRNPSRCARPSTPSCSAPPKQALQDGLARYEAKSGRADYEGPELNLGEHHRAHHHRAEHPRAAARPRREAGLADRAAERAAAALRRALAGRGGSGPQPGQRPDAGPRRPARRPHRAAVDAGRRRARRAASSTT